MNRQLRFNNQGKSWALKEGLNPNGIYRPIAMTEDSWRIELNMVEYDVPFVMMEEVSNVGATSGQKMMFG
jgi:hypothetical protein